MNRCSIFLLIREMQIQTAQELLPHTHQSD
jgi:hypothetical protein